MAEDTSGNSVWPPSLVGENQPHAGQAGGRTMVVAQVCLGLLAGVLLDPLVETASRGALIGLKIITLVDDFDFIYSPEGIQRATIWSVFVLLAICFWVLRRRRVLAPFATTALVTHCLVGGLYTLFAEFMVNFWV